MTKSVATSLDTNKSSTQRYNQLWKVEAHLRRIIGKAFKEAYSSNLRPDGRFADLKLRGTRPEDWPDNSQGYTAIKFIDIIQRGILFYCMEDLLWPQGRGAAPNNDIFWGSSLRKDRYIRCGEKGTLGLDKALRSRRHPGRQPIALRTYTDALNYYKAGIIADHLFPYVNERWAVKWLPSNSNSIVPAVLKPVSHSGLCIHGNPAGKIAAARKAEIYYVVGTKKMGKCDRDMFAPPTRAYEHAFRRQLEKLYEEWKRGTSSNTRQPTDNWIRERLGVWDGEDPEHGGGFVDDGVVKAYKQAFKNLTLIGQ
ncbi:hypothetical protein [uncultured Ruegeria sp.]|uniref:hypothetical protein n=1 Tax=uncultured Ruegeria sp. TaxID=259304 RepID=UPI0026374082|nr:hypothetical protein [uncultured Ruegeria sp.]